MGQKQIIFKSSKLSSFEATEVKWAKEHCSEVLLISTSERSCDKIDGEFFYIPTFFDTELKIHHLFQFFPELFVLLVKDAFTSNISLPYILRWRKNFSLLLKVSIQTELLKHIFLKNLNTTPYSFFTNDHALLLALAKKRGYLKRAVSRAHGRDIIEYREPVTGKLPFQWLKYQYLDAVYCASSYGQSYIQNKYPKFSEKIFVQHLGTRDMGIGPLKPQDSECYVIASIGTVRNVKRFFLIAEMLRHTKLKVRWVHFGEVQHTDPTVQRFSNATEYIEKLPNITLDFRGFVANEVILDYFKNNFVDVLISTSHSEGGAPVSIQEAISFGIPCLATDVGGTSDIVNNITGKLISKDFEAKYGMVELEQLLLNFSRNLENRLAVREFWENNFMASKNYPEFFSSLSKIKRFDN